MENYKLIKFLIPIFILGFFIISFNNVFAYSVETHAFLTDEISKFYNQNFPNNKISNDLASYLLDGARREDDAPRWMNHFFDPIYNRGLTDSVLGTWQKSKDWAQDDINQISALYNPVLNSTLADLYVLTDPGKLRETDFSWQRAIADYVKGDQKRAFYALGHIIHLIEDASVPDHTRNDPHPGDSVYENYTQKFTLSNPDVDFNKRLLSKTPFILSDLGSYFDALVKYSNNGFYSKDRIGVQDGYNLPEPNYFEILNDGRSYGIYQDREFGDYPIIKASSILEVRRDELLNRPLIASAYWSRLSTKSVQYGAGVINLFFQEVEKAKNDPNFIKQEEESFFGKIIGKIKNLTGQAISTVGGFFSDLLGGDNQGFQPAGQISLDKPEDVQLIGQAKTDEAKNIESTGDSTQTPAQTSSQSQNQIPKSNSSKNIQQPQIIEEDEELNEQQEIQEQIQQEQQKIIQQPEQIQLLGKTCSFATGDNKTPSRQGVIINEVAWMGTSNSANDEWIELKNISGGAVDINGWQIIDQGEQIKIQLGLINKTKLNSGEFVLLERTDDDSVLGITADFVYTGALSNTNEGLRLFDGQCNLIDEVLADSNWPAGDSAQKRSMERSSDLSWHTYNGVSQNNIFGTPKKENSQPTVATTSGSNGDSTTIIQQPTTNDQQQTVKILINEVQIAGVTADDEFIELYNPNNQEVDLKNWVLKKKTSSGSESNLVSSASFSGTIPGLGYFLIVHQLKDDGTSNYQGQASPNLYFSGKTYYIATNNTILLYDQNNNLIDKVGFGLASDCDNNCALNPDANNSIQRKFQNSTFVDTDNNANDFEIQNCPSPKTQPLACQSAQNNQAPSAFFVYTPQNPEVNEEIIFNAASSTDDGQIISYQWDFGDNATSSVTAATTTHSYPQAGNYSVSLIVFDNNNATSTATSTIISVNPSQPAGVDHLVISEILFNAEGDDVGKEFIELYNPTGEERNLSGWSLKYAKENSTSTESLASFGSVQEDVLSIFTKRFLLVGFYNYDALNYGNKTADIKRSKSLPNGSEQITVILYDVQGNEIDKMIYGDVSIAAAGQSLERKAWQDSQCVSSQLDGEFLGNDCDRDYDDDNDTTDFEIRQTPNPQNSQSLAEPRTISTSITEESWDISYNPDTLSINFSWPENPNLTYEIMEYNSPGVSIFRGSGAVFSKAIDEVGRKYKFSIQAFDTEGAGSELIYKEIEAPSFLKEVYFYKNPQTGDNLVELRYEKYPFLPNIYPYGADSWHSLILYFNQEPAGEPILGNYGVPVNTNDILQVKYGTCGDSGSDAPHYNILLRDDIVSESSKCYPAGGIIAGTLYHGLLEDKNLILKVVIPEDVDIQESDYLTIAYYGRINAEPSNDFKLIAVDKIKHHFQNESPEHQPPTAPSDFQTEFNGVDTLIVSFASSNDPDTIDSLINYQLSSDGENWQTIEFIGGSDSSRRYTQTSLNLGENYKRYFRSVDDFGLTSESVEVNWQYPPVGIRFSQDQSDSWSDIWGTKDYYWNCGQSSGSSCPTSISLQSFVPESDFEFDLAAVKLKQSGTGTTMEIMVLNNKIENEQDKPDFNNVVAVSETKTISNPDENKETIFSFNSPASLSGNNKYWFVLNVNNYSQESSFYNNISMWQNVLLQGNVYAGGEAAKAKFGGNDFQILPDADWYLKLALSGE